MRIRFETKPGKSFASAGVLPSSRARSTTAATVSSEVAGVRTTSTSAMTGTGLKKCMPITRSGRPVTPASEAIGIEDVLDASTAPGGTILPARRKISCFTPASSTTASTSRSAGARSSTASTRISTSSGSCGAPFSASRSRLRRIVARPFSTAPGAGSCSRTRRPEAAITWAIPPPIWPAPTTRTRANRIARGHYWNPAGTRGVLQVMIRTLPVALAALALLGRGGTEEAAPPPGATTTAAAPAEGVLAVWNSLTGSELFWADGRTLEPVDGRAVSFSYYYSAVDRSPDGGTLALGADDRGYVQLVDLDRMESLGTIDVGGRGYFERLHWVAPDLLLASVSGLPSRAVVLDPPAQRVLSEHELDGTILSSHPVEGGPPPPPRMSTPALAVEPPGGRALGAPAGNRVAEVDLETLEVAHHDLSE